MIYDLRTCAQRDMYRCEAIERSFVRSISDRDDEELTFEVAVRSLIRSRKRMRRGWVVREDEV